MNFRSHRQDEPQLNLIPMIDVLIVLMIFLLLTTTFSRETRLQVTLPEATATTADAGAEPDITVGIAADGRYRVNQRDLAGDDLPALRQALKDAAGQKTSPLILIDADRDARHQSVMSVLDAAGQLGFQQIGLAARQPPAGQP